MLTNTHGWSHTCGNTVVPYRWQATDPGDRLDKFEHGLVFCYARIDFVVDQLNPLLKEIDVSEHLLH